MRRLRIRRDPLEQRPATDEAGTIWAGVRVVLARRGMRELWWVKAGTCYSDQIHNHRYVESKLVLADLDPDHAPIGAGKLRTTKLHEGGRLTRTLLARYAEQIETFLKRPGLVDAMDMNATNVIGE